MDTLFSMKLLMKIEILRVVNGRQDLETLFADAD